MLGTRTKQVFAYGRRGHRIVNATEDRKDDLNEPPACSTSRPERKERGENLTARRPSVKVKVKKTVVSSDSSSDSESSSGPSRKSEHPDKYGRSQKSFKAVPPSPARKPLSAVSSNVPSPRAAKSSTVPMKKRRTPKQAKGTSRRSLKPTSPIVNMDIVVFDVHGHKVSQERRVSRTDVKANPLVKSQTTDSKKLLPGSSIQHAIVLSDEDDESSAVRKGPKPSRARTIIISSDEESEEEPGPLTKLPGLRLPPESPPPKPTIRRNRRTTTVPSPPTSPDVEVANAKSTASVRQMKSPKPHQSSSKPSIAIPLRQPLPTRVDTVFSSSLLSPPAPHFRPRQLTPIKCRGRSSIFPARLSSSTDSESDIDDLSFDLNQLALSPRTLKQVGAVFDLHEKPPSEYLVPLLDECSQTTAHEFSAFIEMFPLDPIVQTSHGGVDIVGRQGSKVSFQKIGEASYSEVFGIGDVVLKVIPLRDEEVGTPVCDDSESPAPSDAKDVLKEIIATRTMGEICDGFVELLRTYVVRGKYPSLLLDLWDEYNERKGSENIRPDTFSVSQLYVIIVLPNGGPDLEAYTFPTSVKTGWRQACSLFWQVARTLAIAEDVIRFEHRDLHWGQILVKSADSAVRPRLSKSKKIPMDHETYGVKATVIDLGLSRMDSEDSKDSVHWTSFDDEVFEGEGDYQFDIYRMMKTHIGKSWEAYRPLTNVMWLHYLVVKLLKDKHLRAPAAPRKTTSTSTFTERECYECLVEVEGTLREAVIPYTVAGNKKRGRKAQAVRPVVGAIGPQNAADVLSFGAERGWILAMD